MSTTESSDVARHRKTAADFARVENAPRIEDFDFFKQRVHLWTVHLFEKRTADQTVVVFGGHTAVILENKIVDFWESSAIIRRLFRIGHLHERNDMEIAVADVSRNRIDQSVLVHEGIELRQKFRQVFRSYDDVVDKRLYVGRGCGGATG